MVALGVKRLAGQGAELFRLIDIFEKIAFFVFFCFISEYRFQPANIVFFQICKDYIGIIAHQSENGIAKFIIRAIADRHISKSPAAYGIKPDYT